MVGMPHQDRLAATMSDAFRTFVTEMQKRMPGRTDVYALFDSDGGYRLHYTHDPVHSVSAPAHPVTAETFQAEPFTTAFTASRRDRSFRTAALHWPPLHPEAHFYAVAILPVFSDDNELIAYLVRLTDNEPMETETTAFMQLAGIALTACIRTETAEHASRELRVRIDEQERRASRKEAQYALAMQIHLHNDADQVLTELMRILELLLPGRLFEIYLSHDQYCSIASVKPLQFRQSDEDSRFRAFTEARLVVGTDEEGKPLEAVFPLRGNQGVYGVLRLAIADGMQPEAETMHSITMLADTAGSAFENARLYEQSNRLVGELRLINEITQRLNQSLKLHDIYHFASTELRNIFDADFSCILELEKGSSELIVRASEPASFFSEHYAVDYGFSGRVIATKEPVIISDYHADSKVRSVWMESTNSRSLLACPIMVEGGVVGVILVAHRRANYFSYDNYKLLQTLSGHIGLAVSNASLHAEVRKMVQTDRLTGLYARHYLDDQIGSFQKKDYCGSLIVVDIDDFKKVNDTHGHQVGDRVLIHVSSIVRSCIREGDIASRWGGEELAVYLSQATKEQAMHVAERIRRRVLTETSPKVSVSCGVSDWNWEDEKISVESLFYRADMALYKAKHSGKNRICIG
ncbi:GGDEF domain-containing protein [Paenibacillus hemerocallicola]|uniref:GGDEF domain-containing protein n=1 Tax=Paenibacillus hemerocallicola TaxID=1172614 RepID=A0A5C4TDM6_9BACL|nr:sensor domain-containing diguanylate cyclase [Paenibacillus hemerocallicola]TNJ67168.1 GGDEF domain-containing protein [Paenibacillus hemerocallicola]